MIVLPAFAPGTEPSYYVEGRPSGLWLGFVTPGIGARQRELDERVVGKELMWVSMWTEDLARSDSVNVLPGHDKKGFVVDSSLMPAFTTAGLAGLTYQPPDATDAEILSQLTRLQVDNYTDVTTLTFGPMFLPGATPGKVFRNYRLGVEKLGRCDGIPHNAAFIDEVSKILNEPGIESSIGDRLARMKNKPEMPIEVELINCLQMVARAFASRGLEGKHR